MFAVPAVALAAPAAQEVGLRLLTESEYRNSIRDIFGSDILVQGRFDAGRRVGGLLAASSAVLSVTPAGLESFSKMADSIASQVVDQKHQEKLVRLRTQGCESRG